MKKQLAISLLALSISTPVWAGQDNPCADLSDIQKMAACITSLQTKIQEQQEEIKNLRGKKFREMTLMGIGRESGNTIRFDDATGHRHKLDLGDGTKSLQNEWIAFRPGNEEKAQDASLYFNLTGSLSYACTLLHSDDDSLQSSTGLYSATGGGNDFTSIWGKDKINTFALSREKYVSYVLAAYASYKILCIKY